MKNQYCLYPIILVALVSLSYVPTFTGEFILDDHHLVKRNPFIRESQPLWSYFTQEDGILAHDGKGEYHTGYYRPVVNISYFLNYKLWGMEASWFRAVNLFLHVATCVLLFLLMAKCFHGGIPLITALFFGLHPANTEVVSWV